jgi:hypothetical protein
MIRDITEGIDIPDAELTAHVGGDDSFGTDTMECAFDSVDRQ